MSRLQKKLLEQYGEHYQHVNASLDLPEPGSKSLAALDLMYGEFVRSLPQDSSVLDLACGTGLLLNWLSYYNNIIPVGVDGSEMQVMSARKALPTINIYHSEGLTYLQNHPSQFHGIFATDILEHIPDEYLLEWVEAIVSALKPGGFFICRSPNAANILNGYSRYMDLTHQRSFTRTSMLQLLNLGGLTNCKILPIQATHLTGKVRLTLENLFHRAIFRLTGRGLESVFTSNVVAVGFKQERSS